MTQRDAHILLTDASGAIHFEQDTFPNRINRLDSFQTCHNLADQPRIFPNGDWTGALQYSMAGQDLTLSASSINRMTASLFRD